MTVKWTQPNRRRREEGDGHRLDPYNGVRIHTVVNAGITPLGNSNTLPMCDGVDEYPTSVGLIGEAGARSRTPTSPRNPQTEQLQASPRPTAVMDPLLEGNTSRRWLRRPDR